MAIVSGPGFGSVDFAVGVSVLSGISDFDWPIRSDVARKLGEVIVEKGVESRTSVRMPDVWAVPVADIVVVGPVVARILFLHILSKVGQQVSDFFSAVPPLVAPSAFIDEGHVAPENGLNSDYSKQNLIQMLVLLHEEDDHADDEVHAKLIENNPEARPDDAASVSDLIWDVSEV